MSKPATRKREKRGTMPAHNGISSGYTLRIAGITAGTMLSLMILVATVAKWSGAMEGEDKIVAYKLDVLSRQIQRLEDSVKRLEDLVNHKMTSKSRWAI